MNKNILNAIFAGAVTLGLASCGENTWNNHYLDGFEGGVNYDKSVDASYTLTAADYATISKLMQAIASTPEEIAAAKAIEKNLYFDKTSPYPAQVAIPAFLETSSFPYYLVSKGSNVDIAYTEIDAVPAELKAITAASTYTVSNADYMKVWGSESAFIKSFAPGATAAANLPGILKDAYPDATEGTYAVVTYNTATENPEFGLPEEGPVTANVYTGTTLTAGKYVMVDPASAYACASLDESKTYGYLPSAEVTVNGNEIAGFNETTCVWEFVSAGADGEFYIKDSYGRYIYQSGTYNNFNVATSTNGDGYVWIVTSDENNTWKILNKAVNKWIQSPSGTYTTWGSYNYASGKMPQLCVIAEAKEPVEIPLFTPASVTENAVYYFNGSKWAVASDVVVLNPADYTAIGVSNNKLVDPEIYLPLYLKNHFPYAVSGDQKYVVYNGTKADICIFDGSTWTINNNGLEDVTGRFAKGSDSWSFVKYIGKAIYNIFEQAQIELNKKYIMVVGDVCNTVIGKNDNYGYLYSSPVTVKNGEIVAPTDANAFLFGNKFVINDKEVTTPESKFFIRDSYDRFLYWDGSHASFNVTTNPLKDGVFTDNYLFSATNNNDGTWTIVCDLGEGGSRTIYYSTSYNNFAIYATASAVDVLPSLYILSE